MIEDAGLGMYTTAVLPDAHMAWIERTWLDVYACYLIFVFAIYFVYRRIAKQYGPDAKRTIAKGEKLPMPKSPARANGAAAANGTNGTPSRKKQE